MQQELKTHIAKIEAKLLRHESTDTFTFEFVSDLVQSFKDIVEKPIENKDVFEVRKKYNTLSACYIYCIYKNDNNTGMSFFREDEATEMMEKAIEKSKENKVVVTMEVANVWIIN